MARTKKAEPVVELAVEPVEEFKNVIPEFTLTFTNEDLNALVAKLNDVIRFIQK